MNKFMTYFKFKLKYLMGINKLKNHAVKGPKELFSVLAVLVLLLISVGCFVFLYVVMAIGMQVAGNMAGLPDLMPRFMITSGQIVIFFTSVISAFGMMSGGKSWEFEASLPIKNSYIFVTRLASVYITELGFSAMIILPAVIVYGIFNSVSLLYWLYGVIGILLYPVIPLAIATVIALAVTFVSAGFKKKELFTTIFSLVIMVAVLLGNMMLNSSTGPETNMGADIVAMMSDKVDSLNVLSYVFPVAGLLTDSLVGTGVGAGLSFIGAVLISVLVMVVIYVIGDKLYFKTVSKTTAAGKSDNKKYKSAGSKSIVKAFFVKEWKLVLRSPVNLLNGLFNVILGPLMLLFVFFKTASEGGETYLVTLLNTDGMFFAVAVALCLLISAMNLLWASTLSREGSAIWLIKSSPVSVKDQMKGRFLAGYSMYLLCAVPMLVIMTVLVKPYILELILAFLVAVPAGLFMVASNMMIDILRPKLIWKLEVEAVKQNVNSMIGMLVSWVWAIVVCVAPVLSAFGIIPTVAAFVISFVLAVGGGVGTYKGMIKFAENRMRYIW